MRTDSNDAIYRHLNAIAAARDDTILRFCIIDPISRRHGGRLYIRQTASLEFCLLRAHENGGQQPLVA